MRSLCRLTLSLRSSQLSSLQEQRLQDSGCAARVSCAELCAVQRADLPSSWQKLLCMGFVCAPELTEDCLLVHGSCCDAALCLGASGTLQLSVRRDSEELPGMECCAGDIKQLTSTYASSPMVTRLCKAIQSSGAWDALS